MTFSAWCSYFILGCAPVIFVRNKGGGSVGSADMARDVKDLNEVIKRHLRDMQQEGGFQLFEADFGEYGKFFLQPRVASDKQHFEFNSDGFHLNNQPNTAQVFIACMNVNQLDSLSTPKSRGSGRAQYMSTIDMLFGKGPFPAKCERPYDALSSTNKPRMRMTMNCDEDDLNRTTLECKNPTEKRNYGGGELSNRLQQLQATSLPPSSSLPPSPSSSAEATASEDDDGVGDSGAVMGAQVDWAQCEGCGKWRTLARDGGTPRTEWPGEFRCEMVTWNTAIDSCEKEAEPYPEDAAAVEVEEDPATAEAEREAAKEAKEYAAFRKEAKGLRDHVYGCTSVSATPMAMFMHLGPRDLRIVVLRPPANYIGYRVVGREGEQEDYLQNFVEVMPLEPRNDTKKISKTTLYREHFMGHDWETGPWDTATDCPPPPFTKNRTGTVLLSKKNAEDYKEARQDKQAVDDAHQRQSYGDGGRAWEADGDNIRRMVNHMVSDTATVERRGLINTNKTVSDGGKNSLAVQLMKEFGDCDNCGVIVLEYSHIGVRIHYSTRKHGLVAMTTALQYGCGDYQRAGCHEDGTDQVLSELWKTRQDDKMEKHHVCESFKLANINHLYSAIERYRRQNPGILLRTVCLSGAIGGRGVRYKGLGHDGILTDQYYAFDVKSTAQCSTHGEASVQIIGRLCGLFCETLPGRTLDTVDDMAAAPAVRLWIPAACWTLVETYMAAQDQVVSMMKQQAGPGEKFKETIARLTANGQYPQAKQFFFDAIGMNSKGGDCYMDATRRNMARKAQESIRELGHVRSHGAAGNVFNELQHFNPRAQAARVLRESAEKTREEQLQERAKWAVLRQAFPAAMAGGGAGAPPPEPAQHAIEDLLQAAVLWRMRREEDETEDGHLRLDDIKDGIDGDCDINVPPQHLEGVLGRMVAARQLASECVPGGHTDKRRRLDAGGSSDAGSYTTYFLQHDNSLHDISLQHGSVEEAVMGEREFVSQSEIDLLYSNHKKPPQPGDSIEVAVGAGRWVWGQVLSYDHKTSVAALLRCDNTDHHWDSEENEQNLQLSAYSWKRLDLS
jgi:hypothetical protein